MRNAIQNLSVVTWTLIKQIFLSFIWIKAQSCFQLGLWSVWWCCPWAVILGTRVEVATLLASIKTSSACLKRIHTFTQFIQDFNKQNLYNLLVRRQSLSWVQVQGFKPLLVIWQCSQRLFQKIIARFDAKSMEELWHSLGWSDKHKQTQGVSGQAAVAAGQCWQRPSCFRKTLLVLT